MFGSNTCSLSSRCLFGRLHGEQQSAVGNVSAEPKATVYIQEP